MFSPKAPIVPSSTTANALATTTTSVNVSNAAAPSVGQVLTATGGSAAIWQFPGGGFNDLIDPCIDGSCVGDGVTDDDAAFHEIVDQGYNVYMPLGKLFRVKTPFHLDSFQTIIGPGLGLSKLIWDNTTEYCIQFDGTNNKLSGFSIVQYATATPTAGGGVFLGNTALTTNMIRLMDIACSGVYNGFTFKDRVSNSELLNCFAYNPVAAGCLIDVQVPYTSGIVINFTAMSSTNVGTGMLIRANDTANIIGYKGVGFPVNLWLKADTGPILQTNITHASLENQTGSYAIRVGDSTYAVQRCSIEGYESVPSSSTTGAIYVGNKAEYFQLSRMMGIRHPNAAIVDYGSHTTFDRCHLDVESGVGGGMSLYGVGARVRDCDILGPFTTASSATGLDLQGNYFGGSVSVNAAGYTGGIIKNNRGLADYLTSISATPLYVGQYAVVAGVGYMAVGVSSSADWKQVTA